jgi:hypothetical protein
MAKVFLKWKVPQSKIEKWGMECYHIRVSIIGLWFRWLLWGIAPIGDELSWKQTKQLAKEGSLVVKKYFVLCPSPLYTSFYYLK